MRKCQGATKPDGSVKHNEVQRKGKVPLAEAGLTLLNSHFPEEPGGISFLQLKVHVKEHILNLWHKIQILCVFRQHQ